MSGDEEIYNDIQEVKNSFRDYFFGGDMLLFGYFEVFSRTPGVESDLHFHQATSNYFNRCRARFQVTEAAKRVKEYP